MNYVLIEVESNGNADRSGGSDRHYHRAMANSKEALVDHCKEKYGKEIGQPKPFNWDNYFIINESKIEILGERDYIKKRPIKMAEFRNIDEFNEWWFENNVDIITMNTYLDLKIGERVTTVYYHEKHDSHE